MIYELAEQGVDKIILLTHYQYDNDVAMAQNLRGVDVVVGGDSHTLLPFANTLTNLEVTGAEIVKVLNEAVDYSATSSGSFPYAAGLRWDVDMNCAEGERLYNVEYAPRCTADVDAACEWLPLEDSTELTVVSNSFTAAGRDGYLTFGTVAEDGRAEDTFLDYAQAFVDYMLEVDTINKPLDEHYSTQNFVPVPAAAE